ncbi:conserved hypothetical protein [Culex quinquefasciatus]|uniref:Mre11 DNA-binding domain-containing protein n=1 Tax=Culex quinquefasciatus TaxID=7176 RepID=B0XFM3_CULQU|nr:conserved hypothetical protein [Culex quinquefasciatus]|eukprot:XP_001868451.1 conserved hypothetical protein [Culex quinquefasciatus]
MEEEVEERQNVLTIFHNIRTDPTDQYGTLSNYIHQFLDLIIWSNEHGREPGVSQPGSTVATSLAEGESFDKRCGILSIHKNLFRMNPIKPQTVADELQLDEGDVQQKVQNFAAEKLTGNQKQPKFPLIRPRIEVIEVEQGYSGRIANPQDMFTFKRKITRVKDELKPLDNDALIEAYQNQREATEKRAGGRSSVQGGRSGQAAGGAIGQRRGGVIIMFYERQTMAHLDAIAAAINEDNIDKVLAGFYEKEKYTYNDMLKMLVSRIQKRGDPNPPRGSLITTMTTLA